MAAIGIAAVLPGVAGSAAEVGTADAPQARPPWRLSLRERQPGAEDRSWWRAVETPAEWRPEETAVIVCDVWDLHHCRNAVERLEEFAPRIAALCDGVRAAGGTVIHAPSDCMPSYERHPARRRVIHLIERNLPEGFESPAAARTTWCSALPGEASSEYPLDQSLGGEDDDPAVHAAWGKELERMGRNPRMPWKMQSPLVPIDADRDWVSDDGAEVARVLDARGIRHVMLVGVHLNMCVLGRPFGLRRLREAGRDVVLVRDLTDTMYDPAQWPWVDHFTGTDLMVEHVERHVCPTVSSEQIIGDSRPFRSPRDDRPTVALVAEEDEQIVRQALVAFARRRLGRRFRVVDHPDAAADPATLVLASGADPGAPAQPELTASTRPGGGRSIHVAVGHADDLARPEVERILVNALHVAAGLAPPEAHDARDPHDPSLRWVTVRHDGVGFPTPSSLLDVAARKEGALADAPLWCRSVIVPSDAAACDGFQVCLRGEHLAADGIRAWFDGREVTVRSQEGGVIVEVPPTWAAAHRAGSLVLEVVGRARQAFAAARTAVSWSDSAGERPLDRWQIRIGSGPGFRAMPLPAMFGGSADAVMILD